jgi:hypothetical protein
MAGNQVTLTIAGDADSLERATRQAGQASDQLEGELTQVGQAARQMASSIGSSEDALSGLGRESGALGEGLDRASGASSMLAGGLGDIGGALTEAFGEDSGIGQFGAQLEKSGTIITGVTGALDLMILANTAMQASWVRSTASMVAAKVSMVATTAATGVATAAQWLWNAAMSANPIGLIIIAIAALVAGIIWVATQTTWFQTIWQAVWGAVVGYFNWVVGNYKAAAGFIVDSTKWIADKIGALPGLIGRAFSGLYNLLTWPFRTAFNFIATAWNNTVGRLSWTIPGWVPVIGGRSISAPRLPTFETGGTIPGRPGEPVLALVHAGETVGSRSAAGTGGGRREIVLRSDGSAIGRALLELIKRAMGEQGGNPDLLGIVIDG